jgi:arylsulfatase A-like enzyme
MKAKIVIVLLLLCAGIIALKLAASGARRPSIVLITLDTTRRDHLSCYGYHRKTTPNLDQLAEEGQRFDKAVAVSSWTLPTHASLFTGLYPSTHGAHYTEEGAVSLEGAVDLGQKELYQWFKADGLSEEALTLAEVLKEAGYVTFGVGSGPWLKPMFGMAQGFQEYDCNVNSVLGRQADEVNALAMPFIKRNAERPFFLFLNYFDPHDPYRPPPPFAFRFFPKDKVEEIEKDSALEAEFHRALYDAEIMFMDHQIGRIVQQLKALDLYEDTWIIVVGDHGEHFGEHGLSGHGYSLFEGTIRCPLIIKWPEGFDALPSTETRCQQVDIMPTVLHRLDLPGMAHMEGRPLGPADHPVVCELFKNLGTVKTKGPRFDRNLIALYMDPFKLIVSTKEGDPDAGLFDLSLDPGETENLLKAQPERAESMRSRLDQWRNSLRPHLAPRKIKTLDPDTEEQLKALGY